MRPSPRVAEHLHVLMLIFFATDSRASGSLRSTGYEPRRNARKRQPLDDTPHDVRKAQLHQRTAYDEGIRARSGETRRAQGVRVNVQTFKPSCHRGAAYPASAQPSRPQSSRSLLPASSTNGYANTYPTPSALCGLLESQDLRSAFGDVYVYVYIHARSLPLRWFGREAMQLPLPLSSRSLRLSTPRRVPAGRRRPEAHNATSCALSRRIFIFCILVFVHRRHRLTVFLDNGITITNIRDTIRQRDGA